MLEDNDVLHARQGAWGIFNAKFTDRHAAVPRALETLDMEVAQIMKGGCGTESPADFCWFVLRLGNWTAVPHSQKSGH